MLSMGEINIFVTDLERALAFWAEGLGLTVGEKEIRHHGGHARLDFEDGSPSIRLVGPVEARREARVDYGERPMIGFDITTTTFDATLGRLLDAGGAIAGVVEKFGDMRVVQISDPDGTTFELVEIPDE